MSVEAACPPWREKSHGFVQIGAIEGRILNISNRNREKNAQIQAVLQPAQPSIQNHPRILTTYLSDRTVAVFLGVKTEDLSQIFIAAPKKRSRPTGGTAKPLAHTRRFEAACPPQAGSFAGAFRKQTP